jgi:hypothetical protein
MQLELNLIVWLEDQELNTFDEVEEGRDETSQIPKKKKKKKKPKKKTVSDQASLPILNETQESPQVSPSTSTKTSGSGKQLNTAFLSLPVEPTVAQSARSYIKAEHLDIQKNKIKSRSDQASIFSNGCKDDKKGMFARFRLGSVKETSEEEQRKAKQSWFSKLSRRATNCMHQLLRTAQDEKQGIAPMKWDHFVAVSIVECNRRQVLLFSWIAYGRDGVHIRSRDCRVQREVCTPRQTRQGMYDM